MSLRGTSNWFEKSNLSTLRMIGSSLTDSGAKLGRYTKNRYSNGTETTVAKMMYKVFFQDDFCAADLSVLS
ncbi:hypothetical protein KP2612_000268 [Komagataella phaffii]